MYSALLLLLGSSTASSFNFSSVFGDDCVLQRDSITAVYGFAAAGASVAVSLDGGAAVSATGQPDGTWKALLPAQPAGSNHTIVATNRGAGGGATTTDITLRRVSFGDVWFCAGQSNMELPLHFTLTRNDTYAAVAAGRYEQISLLHFDHNPLPQPARVVGGDKVLTPWMRAAAALRTGALDKFAAACWYFGESLADRLEQAAAAGPNAEKVPIGLIESAFGGTMIESWLPVASQLGCANITCTANQTQHFTKDTAAACAAAATSANAKGAGSNGELFNGMVSPFVDFTLKGWLWYQGENNLGFHAGNVLDGDGYACMLPALIGAWRAAWSATAGTTAPLAPFGIVMLADSTDEGWGANVPQMHWAQTANVGYAPNAHLPGTFLAAAHDLADPWDDGCNDGALCCVDTGEAPPLDPRCNAAHRGFLVQNGAFPGAGAPVTPTMGVTIHPRVKRQVGARLAQAAWGTAYGHGADTAFTGPVLSGCAVEGGGVDGTNATIRVKFNRTLLVGDRIAVRDYNRTEQASVVWVLLGGGGGGVPADAARNWLYANRQPWWGDSSDWVNVDILRAEGTDVIVALPAGTDAAAVRAIQYGHLSPKGHPQGGHDKICCGNRNFATDPCAPESCPISSVPGAASTSLNAPLPAMPFHAAVVGGKCRCFAPQICDE